MVFLLFSDKRVRGFGNKAMDGNRKMTGKSFDDENGFGKRFMRFVLLRLVSEIYMSHSCSHSFLCCSATDNNAAALQCTTCAPRTFWYFEIRERAKPG